MQFKWHAHALLSSKQKRLPIRRWRLWSFINISGYNKLYMNYNIVTYILESDISYDLTSIHGSYISIRETSIANIKQLVCRSQTMFLFNEVTTTNQHNYLLMNTIRVCNFSEKITQTSLDCALNDSVTGWTIGWPLTSRIHFHVYPTELGSLPLDGAHQD